MATLCSLFRISASPSAGRHRHAGGQRTRYKSRRRKRWRWWGIRLRQSVTALSILRLLPAPPVVYPAGDILFNGDSLLHAPEAALRKVRGNQIAMIFQEPMVSLNPLHTIEKQLVEVLMLHRGLRREAARAEIVECPERVGIRQAKSRLQDYPHQLSGGERQRVMIAMAVLTRPKLLIADEPTTALDVTIRAQILTLLQELKQEMGMGLLFITHNLNIVRRPADNVAVMRRGDAWSKTAVRNCSADRSILTRSSCWPPRTSVNRCRCLPRPTGAPAPSGRCSRWKICRCASPSAAACCAARWIITMH